MNTVAVIGRMLLALVVVLGVMWGLARWARKPMGGKADRVMTVLARQQLSRTSSVTVLRVMDRALVLGVTEQGVQLISETELSAVEEALATETGRGRSRKPLAPAQALEEGAGESLSARTLSEHPLSARTLSEHPLSDPTQRPAGRRRGATALDGSVLSPKTWSQLVSAARELTVRR
ncbi:MAG: flagellar biosynthetic protein FliO [Jatrophihabitantaceae bacterium]